MTPRVVEVQVLSAAPEESPASRGSRHFSPPTTTPENGSSPPDSPRRAGYENDDAGSQRDPAGYLSEDPLDELHDPGDGVHREDPHQVQRDAGADEGDEGTDKLDGQGSNDRSIHARNSTSICGDRSPQSGGPKVTDANR